MKNTEQSHIIFSEIINSYSPISDIHFGELFIKHFSHLESLRIEKQYLFSLNEAKKNNIPTNMERVKSIILDGSWTEKEEENINDTIKFITGIKESVSKEFLLSKRRMLKREISSAEKRLNTLLIKKDFFLGTTAEKFAHRQSTYHQIINSFYLDDKLTIKINPEELEDDNIYNNLLKLYGEYQDRVNQDIIKNISISSFFTNLFHMCADNAYYFYGKPIVQLTNHQSDLFLYGKYFKNLLSQYGDKLPTEMSENPDDMMEFFEISKNVEESGILKEDENGGNSATSIMGATKEDLKIMGIDSSQIRSVADDMKKLGKDFLTKDDLYNLRS